MAMGESVEPRYTTGYTHTARPPCCFALPGVREIRLGKFFDHINGWERAKWIVNKIESIAEHAAAMQPGSVSLWRKRDGRPSPL
jgi:hypothetical protein